MRFNIGAAGEAIVIASPQILEASRLGLEICIYGAGAIGCLIAAHLAKAGATVSVLARGRQLEAIRTHGITVEMHGGEIRNVAVAAASDAPQELGPQDVVIVTVKAPALAEVAAGIGPLLKENTAVVFVTNGIPWWYFDGLAGTLSWAGTEKLDPGGVLHQAFGAGRAIGAVIYSACTVVGAGVVRSARPSNSLLVGEPDGTLSARAVGLAELCRSGGLPCEVTPDIRAEVWGKLLTNLASGPICLLSRSSMARSFADPVIRKLAVGLVQEGMEIAGAMLGRPLAAKAGTIIDKLAIIDHKPSILQDFELGRPLETEALFEVPKHLACLAGVATPLLDMMTSLACLAAETGVPAS